MKNPIDTVTFCNTSRPIKNSIPFELQQNADAMVFTHNTIDKNLGFVNTSGYRCYELNKLVGGAAGSDHVKALAIDGVPSIAGVDVVGYCENIKKLLDTDIEYRRGVEYRGYDWNKIILEYNSNRSFRCVHISLRNMNGDRGAPKKKCISMWYKGGSSVAYYPGFVSANDLF